MKCFKPFFLLLTGMLFIAGCATAPVVTKLSDNQYDIYVRAGYTESRNEIINKWIEAAKETCKGNYEAIDGPKTEDKGSHIAAVGKIRCK
jgi:hypothetical protein